MHNLIYSMVQSHWSRVFGTLPDLALCRSHWSRVFGTLPDLWSTCTDLPWVLTADLVLCSACLLSGNRATCLLPHWLFPICLSWIPCANFIFFFLFYFVDQARVAWVMKVWAWRWWEHRGYGRPAGRPPILSFEDYSRRDRREGSDGREVTELARPYS